MRCVVAWREEKRAERRRRLWTTNAFVASWQLVLQTRPVYPPSPEFKLALAYSLLQLKKEPTALGFRYLSRVNFVVMEVGSFWRRHDATRGVAALSFPGDAGETDSLGGVRALGTLNVVAMDGSRGDLDGLARQYAEELRTHFQDVLERLEELRRRRVAADFAQLPPSSSLNEPEDDTGGADPYGLYDVRLASFSGAGSPQR
ncbi:hypothetical protein HPB47_004737 [Ixodes persulcatus]|uniref:Uncharacterized protein n=1 Tax=Ixodes persulcatus TaxID=34615 RepID=A0AC60PEW1_IXOPE|nr:hypothetical protein HPB47_004737 [Ixodes persulcatus]